MRVAAKRRRQDDYPGRDAPTATATTAPAFKPKLPIPNGVRVPAVEDMLATLSPVQIQTLLISIIAEDPSKCALSALTDAWTQQLQKELTRVIDFDWNSEDVCYVLNTKYKKLSGSKQYDAAGDAFDDVVSTISEIRNKVSSVSSYGTKLSALETLRKIGKSILLSNDTLGHEVRKQFQYDSAVPDAMIHVLKMMSVEERTKAGCNVSEQGKGALTEKVNELIGLAKGSCIGGFDHLVKVQSLLQGSAENDIGGAAADRSITVLE